VCRSMFQYPEILMARVIQLAAAKPSGPYSGGRLVGPEQIVLDVRLRPLGVAKSHHFRRKSAVRGRLITCEVATTCHGSSRPSRLNTNKSNLDILALGFGQRAARAFCRNISGG
jgi:hypothetical protein